jgi:putative glutamine amidotransferase
VTEPDVTTNAAATTIAVAPARKMDDYREAMRLAGIDGHELVFEQDAPEAVVARHGGVLLLGGSDVDPALYGEERHPATEVVAAPRDTYEIALVHAAITRDLPIFAICRGIQLLNVALGGSLVQDIPTEVIQHLDHNPGGAPSMIGHYIEVTPGTTLAELLAPEIERDGFFAVNSRHHQAIKKVAEGLKVTASSVDGVIEGVERPSSRFCVGVQWHPESFWQSGRFQGLFKGFLAAAQATRR